MCRLERGFNVFMEAFSQFVGHVDSMIWSMVLVLLCLGVGLYLSIRMKFPQIRFLKEMVHLLGAKEESENGITPFQAFATTVGARVGMGNIAGVASADDGQAQELLAAAGEGEDAGAEVSRCRYGKSSRIHWGRRRPEKPGICGKYRDRGVLCVCGQHFHAGAGH